MDFLNPWFFSSISFKCHLRNKHGRVCIIHCAQYSVNITLYTVKCVFSNVHSCMWIVYCANESVNSTARLVKCILFCEKWPVQYTAVAPLQSNMTIFLSLGFTSGAGMHSLYYNQHPLNTADSCTSSTLENKVQDHETK